jgi:epoxyqueuosine reductase
VAPFGACDVLSQQNTNHALRITNHETESFTVKSEVEHTKSAQRILLHTCCAPCAAPSAERLVLGGRKVVLYFSNFNIHPEAEYLKRLETARKLAEKMNLVIEEDQYDHAEWLAHIRGLENEPEKGERCRRCFEFSLRRTDQMAERLGIDAFTTTLTLSPHKISRILFEVGAQFPRFEPVDFKKQGGFLRSIELSSEFDLYRQTYCGCEFSRASDSHYDFFGSVRTPRPTHETCKNRSVLGRASSPNEPLSQELQP